MAKKNGKTKADRQRKKRKQRAAARNSAPSTDRKSGKKGGGKKGKKKVKKEGKRITSSLKDRADKGNKRAKQIRNRKIEKNPKNLGRSGQRGESARKAAQQRQARLARQRRQQNQDTLSSNSIVDPNRLMEGTMSAEYTAMMNQLGDVTAINDDLKVAMNDLRTNTANEKAEFQAEIDGNKQLMADLQFGQEETIREMQAARAQDREMYNASLTSLSERYAAQDKLTAEAQRAQALQRKRADNLAMAYIPGQEDSLATVRYGDNRKKKRKAKNNRLSELRINTAVMPSSGQLSAGLQLA